MPVDQVQIEQIAAPVASRHGCELVDLCFRREAGGWVLRLFIDRPEGVGVDLCAEVSRDLSAELDVADVIEHKYTLEVSSPGLNRPLTKAADFRRYLGRAAKLKTREPFDGRRQFSGRLRAVAEDDSAVIVESEDGATHTIPITAIAKANLKIEI